MIKLLMIAQNEAHTLARTLLSLAPLVDSYLVLDTGSTDRTRELVREWAAHYGIIGEVCNGSFEDYAQARNACWQLARQSDPAEPWHLWADADDIYQGDADFLRMRLRGPSADCYELRQVWPDGEIMVPRLFRADLPWFYRGRVHERVHVDASHSRAALVDHRYHHTPSPLGLRRSQMRWKRDLVWLTEDLEQADNEAERAHLAHHIAATKRWLKALKHPTKDLRWLS